MNPETHGEIGSESFVAQTAGGDQRTRKRFLDAIVRDRPEVGMGLERILTHPVVEEALIRAARKDAETLARDFANDLKESFGDLGDACPSSIETIDLQMTGSDTVDGLGTTGSARDYLMQRLTGTVNIADLALVMILPPDLQQSFEREADKLATFLVSLKRAEQLSDEDIAA